MAEIGRLVVPDNIDERSPSNNNRIVEENPVEIYNAAIIQPYQPTPKKESLIEDFTHLSPKQAHHHAQTSFDFKELLPISKTPNPNSLIDSPNDSESILVNNDVQPRMSNPIKPITSFISKKTNTNVDFGTKKASKSKKGGFFVKIGKFEVSRNKH